MDAKGGKMKQLKVCLGVLFCIGVLVLLWASPGSAQTFTPTGSMSSPRVLHTAILLNNGMVLIVGGYPEYGPQPIASAELYDPATGTFSPTGSMGTARASAKAIRLNNGKVLILGGSSGTEASASAELYDPATGTFTATGNMTVSRYLPTASLLNNGKVLVAGGWGGSLAPPAGGPLYSVDLYDPETGFFTPAGSMTEPRYFHSAAVLNNGKVLLAGGCLWPNSLYLENAELYDPGDGSFTATAGNMSTGRESNVTVLLKNGKVLLAGGWRPSPPYTLVDAEVFDPATDAFVATGSMNIDRYGHTGTLLNDGKVLIAGGSRHGQPQSPTAELYEPATGAFTFNSNMTVPRSSPTATLLDNGKVLLAGGSNNSVPLASAELYAPAPTFSFEGFFSPIDNNSVNKVNAGQTIPVKWRLTEKDGLPISDPASFISIKSLRVDCATYAGDPINYVEDPAAGPSGLQYLGDGWWQYNWKTSKNYAGECRIMKLTLGDYSEYTASFTFK